MQWSTSISFINYNHTFLFFSIFNSKHVLSEDVIQRSVDKDGRLFTRKLLCKTNSAPKWTERFLPSHIVYILEDSTVDIKAKTLTTHTRNIGMKNFMTIDEEAIYKPHENNQSWTITEKKVSVDSSFYGLSSAVKRFGLERYKQNIKKAYKGFNITLESMYGAHKAKNSAPFNIVLKQNIKDGATKASEFAKSKVPIVIAADDTQ